MQNRKAPAYQEYAAEMMAQLPYRQMILQERGLLYTMRNECWINTRLPEKPEDLAKVLGFPADEISNSLTAVMPFFAVSEGYIICPELEDYRAHLQQIREAKICGGKRGAAVTNRKRNNSKKPVGADATGMPPSMPQLTRQVMSDSLVKSKPVEPSQTPSLGKGVIQDPWVDDYENAEKNEYGYARTSRGG